MVFVRRFCESNGRKSSFQGRNGICSASKAAVNVNQRMENTGFPHRFSNPFFEATQGLEALFHSFHMPYYY